MKGGIDQSRRGNVAVAQYRVAPAPIRVLTLTEPLQAVADIRFEFSGPLRLILANELQRRDGRGRR